MRRFSGLVAAAGSLLLAAALPCPAAAQNVSAPVILQWFESSWDTIERRTADFHAAGYGGLWTPPPGRALYTEAGGGIGYDIYDRFDLGGPRDTTLYGTELGYRRVIREAQRTGGSVYVDYVHHHVGSFDLFPGNSPGPYVQDRYDYPGFELSLPGQQDGDTYRAPSDAPQGDPAFEYQFRLARLVTLNFTASNPNEFVRNPVPGFAANVPQAADAWAVPTATTDAAGRAIPSTILRQANTPTEANRRFYPDQDGPARTVVDGGVAYTVYDFNTADPTAGDPVAEGVGETMMRYAQWLVQDVGVDGLRVDAARHVPLGAGGDPYNPTQVDVPRLVDRAVAGANPRTNLDGTARSVFQFQEVFNGDPNFLQTFVRTSAAPGDTTDPNRDVLDFPMWYAMRENLSANAGSNNWYNIRNASQDARDDGLANNGSQSIGFVGNHDEGGVHLSNVAHAWILTRPGNAYVYLRGNDFDRTGNTQFFLKDGRGDALGGQYGSIITDLVEIRNAYGRGDFQERWIDGGGSGGFSNVYAYEREGSMLVGLSSDTTGAGITSFDERTMGSSFAPGTRLIELTGNAADSEVDPLGQIPELVTVGSGGSVTMRIPRNQNVNGGTHGRGYVMYGLPRPVGTVGISAVAQTIAGETPTPATNSSARLSAIDVVTADAFTLSLDTEKVVLADGFHDTFADGASALFRFNEGMDLNGNGQVDYASSAAANATRYGFEAFTTVNEPGYDPDPAQSGAGRYAQAIDATELAEGYHYVTVRAFRNQGAGESEVFTDFRQTIYVDRLPPEASLAGFEEIGGVADARDLLIRSDDLTADSVDVLWNLPAGLDDSEVLALVSGSTAAEQIDRDLFSFQAADVMSGNLVATVVTTEITGNRSIRRIPGLAAATSIGRGLGDLDFDGGFTAADVEAFETVVLSRDEQFNPAGDLDGDGLVNTADMLGLRGTLTAGGAGPTVEAAVTGMLRRRADLSGSGGAGPADIDLLRGRIVNPGLSVDRWTDDINADGVLDAGDLTSLVEGLFETRFGDLDLDGTVGQGDLETLVSGYGATGGWAPGNVTLDTAVGLADLSELLAGYEGPAGLDLGDRPNLDVAGVVALRDAGMAATLGPILVEVAAGASESQDADPRIAVAGSLTKAGGGTLVLDAAAGYSGPTTVAAGTLEVVAADAVAASEVTVGSGATLAAAPGTTIRAPRVTLAGGTLAAATLAVNAAAGIETLAINAGGLAGGTSLVVGPGGLVELPAAARVTIAVAGLEFDEAAGGGRLDLGGGEIAIQPGSLTEAELVADILAGRGDGSWDGATGITSAAAAASAGTRTVGYLADGSGGFRVSFAAAGDTDLDGVVDLFDVLAIANSGVYNTQAEADWSRGDFNYDGVTNLFDILALLDAGAYGQGSYFAAAPTETTLAAAAVPEPGAWLPAAGVLAGLLAIRARRRA